MLVVAVDLNSSNSGLTIKFVIFKVVLNRADHFSMICNLKSSNSGLSLWFVIFKVVLLKELS